MKIYYKKWNKEEVEIPQDGIILDEINVNSLKSTASYPETYCWEAWIMNKIGENENGYFDFSKNLIDIGAGMGEYCWLPFNHVYAFEPNKSTLYLLHANLVLHNRIDGVDTFQDLLSDKNEIIRFDGFCTDKGETSGYNSESYTEIESKMLDSFSFDNVGLIKIDVEGMEEKVLRGGIGTIIRNNYPPILFECWSPTDDNMTQEKRDSLFNFLKSLGYEILEKWGDWETHLAVHKNQLNK